MDLAAPRSTQSSPLKPMFLAGNKMVAQHDAEEEIAHVRQDDLQLKKSIRILRVLQRLLATGLSLAALIPLTMTLIKFLQTKDIYKEVQMPDGTKVNRTAWAGDTIAWPTYMYFSIAATSFIMNLGTLIGYFWSTKAANYVAHVGSAFDYAVKAMNLIVWIVAAAIYKYEKEVLTNNLHRDLWGWSCSTAADQLQKAFVDEVPFGKYCTVQSGSWFAGLAHIGSIVLGVIITLMAGRRKTMQGRVKRETQEYEGQFGGPGSYGGAPQHGH
ncbi:Autophagy-related protein 22-2 [Venturia nashicola]|uniref:Autophagy-related protein 22-2 n=1 Tax=Venturia nashicola TaxID=86259 RepID=A0A4Z1NEZ8_9PEZI|nr:Autophagy-related protein 22-2 [Venturia nashicola]TLD19455.1 Autophagy-related protein 22-2 [Venturia nashicola]